MTVLPWQENDQDDGLTSEERNGSNVARSTIEKWSFLLVPGMDQYIFQKTRPFTASLGPQYQYITSAAILAILTTAQALDS